MGEFGILFCNKLKRVFIFLFFIMVNGRKTHSCVEEKKTISNEFIFFFFIMVRPTLMGAFGILFCNNLKRVLFFYFVIMVNGRKTHSCVEEKMKTAFKIIAK